ncbi:hypothetical protein [Halalkalicoccus salilacus]
MYSHFAVSEPDREPDLVYEITTQQPDPDSVLGKPNEHYGRDGDRFIVRNSGSNFFTVNEDWNHITASPGQEPFYVVYLIEFEARRQLAKEGYALIHASGVQIDGRTHLFPAWRSAGKTNTLLSLLQAGGNYLSDDRLWVNADGSALGYPLSVNMQPHNLESFPGASDIETEETMRTRVSGLLDENVEKSRSIVDKGLYFLNKEFLKQGGREFFSVDELIPQSEFVEEAEIDTAVVLRAAPKASRISCEEIASDDASIETTTISHYEWNGRIEEYFRAFDALFPEHGGKKVEQFEQVIDEEERIFAELFDDIGTYRAFIPRQRNWSETGLDRDLVETVSGLEEPPEASQSS